MLANHNMLVLLAVVIGPDLDSNPSQANESLFWGLAYIFLVRRLSISSRRSLNWGGISLGPVIQIKKLPAIPLFFFSLLLLLLFLFYFFLINFLFIYF